MSHSAFLVGKKVAVKEIFYVKEILLKRAHIVNERLNDEAVKAVTKTSQF